MIELIGLYIWTLVAGVLMAPALALIGAQLSARDQAMQSLVLSQASALGVVVGLAALTFMHEPTHIWTLLPTVGALVFGAFAFTFLERQVPKTLPSRNSHYVTAFAFFLALTFLVTSLTPQLESHMATVYFGDLAVATETESIVAAMLGAMACLLLLKYWRSITDDSFQLALFGLTRPRQSHTFTKPLFLVIALLTISLSIQILGLLFTLGCLFIPTALLARPRTNLKRHTTEITTVAVSSAFVGILLSLQYTHIPTVPCVIMALIFCSLATRWLFRYRSKTSVGAPITSLKSVDQ